MKNKFLLLSLFLLSGYNFLQAQATDAHLWVNEFHYDNMSSYQVDDQDDFVELIIHNDLLNDATELAKYQLVLYASGAGNLDAADNLPGKGLPYSKSSNLFTDAETFHPLNETDPNAETGFNVCAVNGANYSVMHKKMTSLQDLPAGFALIYNNSTIVQLLSYEKSFKIKDHIDAGAAAGLTTDLIDGTESSLTMEGESVQLTGTSDNYDGFNWTDATLTPNTASPCAINNNQTINNLSALPPPPLPIELLDLTAAAQEKTIQLDWLTATERENAGFHVERRSNGQARFETMGFVAGKGTTSEVSTYQWLDAEVKLGQTYYYRLRQVDTNGKTSYSGVVSARLVGKDIIVNVAPNPATDVFNIQLGNIQSETTLSITTVDGRSMYQAVIPVSESQNLQLEVNNWTTGMYILRVENEDGVRTEKVAVW